MAATEKHRGSATAFLQDIFTLGGKPTINFNIEDVPFAYDEKRVI
jgi:hypothetical protein